MKYTFLYFALFFFSNTILAQQPTQSIKGTVLDEDSQQPVSFAAIIVLNTEPIIGTTTDIDGNFKIENINIGRYDLKISFIGYEPVIMKEIVVSSSKETIVKVSMKESAFALDEVVIKPTINKEKPLNRMATVSARMLSVEEAKRYAGGFDDPARLASSFAGASMGVNSNAIVIRGNSPKSLQWKLEGIEIPNPNHYADLVGFGGGAVTALSGQLLANSDFFTGAFPAEYNNATSGVFDIFMRNGNNDDYEHTFQVGVMGIDFASEGPLKKNSNSSYIFNYRYSTFGLVGQITGANEGLDYQDISFKLNFPTKKSGVFSLWGIGLVDGIKINVKDSIEQYYDRNKEDYDAQQYMGAGGISHKIFLNNKSQLKTSLATTIKGIDWQIKRLNSASELKPLRNINSTNANYILKSSLNTKFNKRHTNKTGFVATGYQYNLLFENAIVLGDDLQTAIDETGFSSLLSAYTNSAYRVNDQLSINLGVNAQLFTLNNNYTIEPRVGLKWEMNETQTIGLGYGLHSRLERINYYFTKNAVTGEYNNKDMDFSKAHHIVLSYSKNLNENLIIKVEPYYQYLFNVPVIENSYFSFINLKDDWFTSSKFVNTGEGRNYGIDFTLEKYMTKGYYYMLTASLFESKYKGGDEVWRDTRYNKNYTLNLLAGKEWNLGKNKQNVLGVNFRMVYQGGERYIPYKETESILAQNVIYDENSAFESQLDPAFILHFGASYKLNKKKVTHEFALKVLNSTSYGDLRGFEYNYINKTIDEDREVIMIPNLSYKLEF